MTAASDLERHLAPADALAADAPAFVRALRQRARARFAALGFPTTRVEDWKYTNVAPIAREIFAVAPDTITDAATALAAAARLDGAVELVFVNGRFAPSLSTRPALPAGVVVDSLAATWASRPALVEPHLGSLAGIEDDGMAALNTACVQDGAFVHLPDGCDLAAPIHCLFVSLANGTPTVSHPRVLVVAGAGSRTHLVEQHVGRGRYWTNAVSEVIVGAGASVAHHKVQREDTAAFHLATISAAQAGDSHFGSHAVALGAALSRAAIATRLDAPGAACVFDGLYVADGTQHVDHHTTIDHAHPRGTSRELYKGILTGRASGVFNGKVFVRPDAQQSDAQQMNQNLLLSDDAQIDTKPQLEIFADDVKCSHGATIGQLDHDAIFYLRARGIDEPEARRLLIYGFANELVERVAVAPLRAHLADALAARLPAVVGTQP
ncbi:MAG: Fe-S cluster assembly protein SufD [Candidatus Binatia bacterium]